MPRSVQHVLSNADSFIGSIIKTYFGSNKSEHLKSL